MKILTKNSDYAIRALIALAEDSATFLSAKEIAQKQSIPYQFLRRILQDLIKNDLIVSKEGGGGGFKILVDPKDVNVVDVIKIFQGGLQLSECMFRDKLCRHRSNCSLRNEMKRVETVVEKEFSRITLQKLLRNSK